jgi:hypothetical protein
MPNGGTLTLVADFYLGTSSSSLSLITTTTFGTNAGKWNAYNYQSPTIPGGTTVYIVTQIRDSAFTPPTIWTPAGYPFGTYYGVSDEFSFVLGTSVLAYPPMWAPGASLGGGFSTWAAGTFNMDQYGIGSRGALPLPSIPEPSTIALVGLAALSIPRRNHRTRGPHAKAPA